MKKELFQITKDLAQDKITEQEARALLLDLLGVSNRLKKLKIWYPDAHTQFDSAEIYWEEDPEELTSMGKTAVGVVKHSDLMSVMNVC